MSYFTESTISESLQEFLGDESLTRQVVQRKCSDDSILDFYLESNLQDDNTKKIVRFNVITDENQREVSKEWWRNIEDTEGKKSTLRYQRVEYRQRRRGPEVIERITRLRACRFGAAARVSPEENATCTMRVEKPVFIEPPETDSVLSHYTPPSLEKVHRHLSTTIDGVAQDSVISPIPDRYSSASHSPSKSSPAKSTGLRRHTSSEENYIPPWKRQQNLSQNQSDSNNTTDTKTTNYIPRHRRQQATTDNGKPSKSTDTLRVHNLAGDMDRDELLTLFRPYGRVRKVHIITNQTTGESQYAFVHYDFQEEAQRALDTLHQCPIPGRGVVLSLEWANQRTR